MTMQTRIRATYKNGVFIPLPGQPQLDLPEAVEVEITVQEAAAPDAASEAERATRLRQIAESMKANSFTGDPPRFTREDLHERR